MSGGWGVVNQNWKKKTKSDGPSLRLWWIVTDLKRQKRWIVKNLKAFCNEHFYTNNNTESVWYERDKRYFYDELSRWGQAYPNWRADKPKLHKHVYNLLGTKDLKLFKGAFKKEIPYNTKEYKALMQTGLLSDVKQFWNDIDFTL